MAKRQHNPTEREREQQIRDLRDGAVRQLSSLIEHWWELCRGWCDTCDPELFKRMMAARGTALWVLEVAMPSLTGTKFDTAEDGLPDYWNGPQAKH
jgi:hypothetical protein